MRQYKIDRSTSDFWIYGVFIKKSFLGFEWWSEAKHFDELERARLYIKELQALPFYFYSPSHQTPSEV